MKRMGVAGSSLKIEKPEKVIKKSKQRTNNLLKLKKKIAHGKYLKITVKLFETGEAKLSRKKPKNTVFSKKF